MRPNRHTIGLIAVLVAMWYAGASQNNAAAYLFAFVTLSAAAVSAVYAWSNARSFELLAEPVDPVYENEPVMVCARAAARRRRGAMGLDLAVRGAKAKWFVDEVRAGSEARVELLAPGRSR